MNFHHHFGRPPRPPPQTPNPNRVLFSGVPTPVASPYRAAASFQYGNTTPMPTPLPSQFDPQSSSYGIQSQASFPSERRALITVDSLFDYPPAARIGHILRNDYEQMNIRSIVGGDPDPAHTMVLQLRQARQESLQHASEARANVEANLDEAKRRVAEAEQCVADAENELQQIDLFESIIDGPFSEFQADLQLIVRGLHRRPEKITMDNLTKANGIKKMDLTKAPLDQIRSRIWCSTFKCVQKTDLEESYDILTFLGSNGAIKNPSIQAQIKEYKRIGVIANNFNENRILCDSRSNLAMRHGLITIYLGLVPEEHRGFFLKRGHPNLNPWASMAPPAAGASASETSVARTNDSLPEASASTQQASADGSHGPTDAAAPSLQRTVPDYGIVEGSTIHLVTTAAAAGSATSTTSTTTTSHASAPPAATGASAQKDSNKSRATSPGVSANVESTTTSNAHPGFQPAFLSSATGALSREAAFLASGASTAEAPDKRSATSATTTAPLPFSASGTKSSPSSSAVLEATDARRTTFNFDDFDNSAPSERLSFGEPEGATGQVDVTEMTLPNGKNSSVFFEQTPPNEPTEADGVAQAPSATEAADDDALPSVEASRSIKEAFAVPRRKSARNRKAPPNSDWYSM